MTTSEISPRPWKLVYSDKDYVVAVFDVNMDIVANVYGYKWRPIERVSDESAGRAHANAQLFLAAPELVAVLAALEELEGWVDKDHAAAVRARALLARIKGESNE